MVSPKRFRMLSSRPLSPSTLCNSDGFGAADGGSVGIEMVNGMDVITVGRLGWRCWRGAAVAVERVAEVSSGHTRKTTAAAAMTTTITRLATIRTAGWRHDGGDVW